MQDNRRIVRLTQEHQMKPFDCGNADLNDFLLNDAKAYASRLLAVTYLLEDDKELLAFFSVSNDRISINESDKATWRKIKKEFPHSKHRSDYPAVKIGRLGVDKKHQNEHIGRLLVNFEGHFHHQQPYRLCFCHGRCLKRSHSILSKERIQVFETKRG